MVTPLISRSQGWDQVVSGPCDLLSSLTPWLLSSDHLLSSLWSTIHWPPVTPVIYWTVTSLSESRWSLDSRSTLRAGGHWTVDQLSSDHLSHPCDLLRAVVTTLVPVTVLSQGWDLLSPCRSQSSESRWSLDCRSLSRWSLDSMIYRGPVTTWSLDSRSQGWEQVVTGQ